EDGIRDFHVTGVQTCALPIFTSQPSYASWLAITRRFVSLSSTNSTRRPRKTAAGFFSSAVGKVASRGSVNQKVEPLSGSLCAPRSEERRVGKEGRERGALGRR